MTTTTTGQTNINESACAGSDHMILIQTGVQSMAEGCRGPPGCRGVRSMLIGSELVLGRIPRGSRRWLPLYQGCGPHHRQSSGSKPGYAGVATCRTQSKLDNRITVMTWHPQVLPPAGTAPFLHVNEPQRANRTPGYWCPYNRLGSI